ncbi:hypothetical protein [uncultured Aquimarina sp.]|uniref:hypothetical protein n=1 Tax=uncultured Aquimarina sp. TaxID=575652 RepID=UPI002628E043|nr:hypothetical protein [uncultured Aquimarina sp.]
MEDFNQMFKSSKAKEMGIKLKEIIELYMDNIEENILGGAKVKLALYTRNGKNNVLCGIQEGSNESCMLYVHHIEEINHERLTFSGKGKHAKRIKFSDIKEIKEDDIKWLLSKINENAPF